MIWCAEHVIATVFQLKFTMLHVILFHTLIYRYTIIYLRTAHTHRRSRPRRALVTSAQYIHSKQEAFDVVVTQRRLSNQVDPG